MEKSDQTSLERSYEIGVQLIVHAGDAKSKAMQAIQAANEYQFDTAKELIKAANQELHEAHQIQTDLIQQEAGGNRYEINILLVHAQDHFAMAMTAIENARNMMALDQKLCALEARLTENDR